MNTIVLMGRLARDPETKLTSTQKGQTKVSRFPLVVKRNRTSKAFVVMITAYGNNAEFVEKYLEKGIKIALSGELVISQIKDEQTGTASYYKEQLAELTVYKEGQVLTGAEVSESGTVFHYENRRQKNAVYNVYAGADIVTAYGTKVYSKGDLVKENLTTGENGSVTLKNHCYCRKIFVSRSVNAWEVIILFFPLQFMRC